MIPDYARMIITFCLSAVSLVLFLVYRHELRKSCMLAMFICSVGDIFMVFRDEIGAFSAFIGAGLFIAAHILYGSGFYKEIKRNKRRIINPGFYIACCLMALSAIWLGVSEFSGKQPAMPVMFALILLYIAAIAYNVCSMFSYAYHFKKSAVVLPFAVTLFYITDIFIFLDMLQINVSLRQYVWCFYPPAQLCILLFNSPLKKSDT